MVFAVLGEQVLADRPRLEEAEAVVFERGDEPEWVGLLDVLGSLSVLAKPTSVVRVRAVGYLVLADLHVHV